MLKKIYLSPLSVVISAVLQFCALWRRPFMIPGVYNRPQRKFMKLTRVSSSAVLSCRSRINIGDNTWVGHYCLIDGIGGVTIGEGVHIASHSCIYSHSSQNAIRLLGRKYIRMSAEERPGYILKSVVIGKYTFIGASCVILPGVTIGKGCVIGAGSVVSTDLPDFSVAVGSPARVVGNTQEIDEELLSRYTCTDTYYLNEIS